MRSSTYRLFDSLCLLVSFYGCSSIFLFCSFTCNWANWHGRNRGLDPWDVYSSGPSEFYYDRYDLTHMLSHDEENLKIICHHELCSLLGYMGTRTNGLMLEIEVKQMSL